MGASTDRALQTFIAESRELLQAMEEGLLSLESAPDDIDAMNAVFRAAHTIKGSAGLFGLEKIVHFTHALENLLEKLRVGDITLDQKLSALLLRCGDHISTHIDHIEQDEDTLTADEEETSQKLVSELNEFINVQDELSCMEIVSGLSQTKNWHISLRFSPDVLRNGMDPLSFLRYLNTFGCIVGTATLTDSLPLLADIHPEEYYLGLEISYRSDATKEMIESTFDFVKDDCRITLLPPHSKISDYLSLIAKLPESNHKLGELLVALGTVTKHELEEGMTVQSPAEVPGNTLAAPAMENTFISQHLSSKEMGDSSLEKQRHSRESAGQQSKLIRVQADKLDRLISLVGELLIAAASTKLMAQRYDDSALTEATSTVTRIVEEIRDRSLQLRMVHIGETFSRFNRVVRDLSSELGKEIDLVITGGDTDLDKSVVEKISDPLLHLVRNSIDHGIEPMEKRIACGKPVRGTVQLNAYHDSGSIIIEVGDDGAGLDHERIKKKALEKGVIAENIELSEKEIQELIFQPGFSTADQVTNISGRGVGMDVVKRNIEAMRGMVAVYSEPGVGTTFQIRLPLTLAIIDGFLMQVGTSNYVVPLDMVIECVELEDLPGNTVKNNNYINLRGEVLPLVSLRKLFDIPQKSVRRENIVVVRYGNQKAGLVVDELLGELQTVIKPLGVLFANLRGIGGSTILGNGGIALILDIPALIEHAINYENHASTVAAAWRAQSALHH